MADPVLLPPDRLRARARLLMWLVTVPLALFGSGRKVFASEQAAPQQPCSMELRWIITEHPQFFPR